MSRPRSGHRLRPTLANVIAESQALSTLATRSKSAREQGYCGSIVNISSIAGKWMPARAAAYARRPAAFTRSPRDCAEVGRMVFA